MSQQRKPYTSNPSQNSGGKRRKARRNRKPRSGNSQGQQQQRNVPRQAAGAKQFSQAPVSKQATVRTQKPSLQTSAARNDGSVRVRHREYVQDMNGSVAFATTSFPVNPGMAKTFPWLSTIASNYESYLFHTLVFEYGTRKSTAADGGVFMVIDYDASDTPPTTKTQQMSYHDAVSSQVWDECCFTADSQDLHKFGTKRYVRNTAIAGTDIKTYDVGNFFFSTQGCADASLLGELYVMYDVELQTPQEATPIPCAPESMFISSDGTVSKTAYLGTTPAINFSTAGLNVVPSSATLTFNTVASFLVTINVVGTGLTEGPPTQAGTVTDAYPVSDWFVNAAGTAGHQDWFMTAPAVGYTFTMDFTPSATTITSGVVYVVVIDPGLW